MPTGKLVHVVVLCALGSNVFGQGQPVTPVTGLGNLAHTTSLLAQTVVFYRDVLGLPVVGADPIAAKPQPLDAENSQFTATKGASFRNAIFRVPGASFGWELTEFSGTARRPARLALQDPGSATLVLQVRDIDKLMTKVKAAHVEIATNGGEPINPTGNAASKLREILLRDPDGFYVELQQPDPLPASAATTQGDVLGGSIQLAIEDTEKSVKFFRDAFGYAVRPSGDWGTNATVAKIIGLPGVQWRITHGAIPGQPTDFALIEYKGPARTKHSMGAEDPGAPSFTMVVGDIDAAIAQWKAAGGTVASTGGVAAKRPNGQANVFVRDVNGMLWELFTRPARAAKK